MVSILKGSPVQLVFCKQGKDSNKQIKYTFRKAPISQHPVGDQLEEWLSTNEGDSETLALTRDPKTILAWNDFYNNLTSAKPMDFDQFQSLGSNLKGYCIFKSSLDSFTGYFRGLPANRILTQRGTFLITQAKGTFNDIKEETGVRVDPSYDFFIKIDKGVPEIKIKNEEIFKMLFGIFEQENLEITQAVQKSKLFQIVSGISEADFIKASLDDGHLRKKMLTEGAREGLAAVSYALFKVAKTKLPNLYDFSLDPPNKRVILNPKNMKESIKSVIRVISYYHRYSLDMKHIFEGPAERMVQ